MLDDYCLSQYDDSLSYYKGCMKITKYKYFRKNINKVTIKAANVQQNLQYTNSLHSSIRKINKPNNVSMTHYREVIPDM